MKETSEMSRNLIRIILLLVAFVTFLANILFILQTSRQMNEYHANSNNIQPKQQTLLAAKPEISRLESQEDSAVKEVLPPSEYLDIQVYSSKENVSVFVNGKAVVELTMDIDRGISIVVLNQATGSLMAAHSFDTYGSKEESKALVDFVNSLSENRILCFAVKDEAALSLQKVARAFMKSYGSVYFGILNFREMWAMVVQRMNHVNVVHAEGYQGNPDQGKWAKPVVLHTSVKATPLSNSACNWEDSEETQRRQTFCDTYDGYGPVCKCSDTEDITFNPPTLPDGTRVDLPIAVMASNRPQYLYRMLKSLRGVQGLRPELVTVYIDGFVEEPASVVKLLGLRVSPHKPISERNARIAQHYKKSLTESFNRHPEANYLVILEEDLDVSVDILSYFSQLLPVLKNDESLYCISAWNDQGYKHSAFDPSMLYRVETMPGLGWVLSRKLYKDELEPKWPKPLEFVDWDMWMRMPEQRKNREAIVPDISRTYHFGGKGLNVNLAFQKSYFGSHALSTKSDVKFDADMMYKDNYEKELHRLLSGAKLLDHSKTPCANVPDFIPDTRNITYLFFFKLNYHGDWDTWINIARCFLLWDLDVRGFHKDLYRVWIRRNHVIFVGCPLSEYCTYKPNDVTPIDMPETYTRPPQDSYLITAKK